MSGAAPRGAPIGLLASRVRYKGGRGLRHPSIQPLEETMDQADLQNTVVSQQAQIRRLENEGQQTAKAAALSSALDAAGLPLVDGGREHLTKLLGDQLAIVPDGRGGRVVLAPNGVAVNDFVKTSLAGAYGHFLKSGSTPAPGGGPHVPVAEPRNISDQVIQRMAQLAPRPTEAPSGDMRQPFGLGRKR